MSIWTDLATKRFPRSVRRIRGDGSHALVMKCAVPWTIYLYATIAERQAGYERMAWSKCQALRCAQDHSFVELDFTSPAATDARKQAERALIADQLRNALAAKAQ